MNTRNISPTRATTLDGRSGGESRFALNLCGMPDRES